ncbi:hypothetical protein [Streptomyces sp. NPDC057889]|uniref:hypothetical protein n=1 Tax=unclassified Streptomyces TaxID=2593676 RepID=UPI0036BAE354
MGYADDLGIPRPGLIVAGGHRAGAGGEAEQDVDGPGPPSAKHWNRNKGPVSLPSSLGLTCPGAGRGGAYRESCTGIGAELRDAREACMSLQFLFIQPLIH